MTEPSALMQKLHAESIARGAVVDSISRILWESGEMTAQWEGEGGPPTWDDILEARSDVNHEHHDAFSCYWLQETQRAEHLMDLDAPQAMTLAMILLDNAKAGYKRADLDMWRKVERAAGFEKGSLTGAPGVPQRIFL